MFNVINIDILIELVKKKKKTMFSPKKSEEVFSKIFPHRIIRKFSLFQWEFVSHYEFFQWAGSMKNE